MQILLASLKQYVKLSADVGSLPREDREDGALRVYQELGGKYGYSVPTSV